MSERVDIGHGHSMGFFQWAPDDLPDNRERYGVPLPNVPRAGVIVRHPRADGKLYLGECMSAVHFDLPELAHHTGPKWTVASWDSLTITPSLLCTECGDHGFIRGGKWVPA